VTIGEILRNNVKEKLARDEVVASMTVRLVRTVEIARIARTAGFDTLYVDLEHSSFSLDACGQICMAALEAGIAPFVRVPANTPEYIARVLEGGALGVIAPHMGSADEARAVVRAAKFPPLGERSNASGLPHLHFRSFPAAEAYAALNAVTMVIVQFESAATLERAEEIIAVDGVDMVLIGVNDLLADLGIPGDYDHPRVREAYAKTIAACAAAASIAASGASPRVPIWSPSSCKWGRVTCRPAPTSPFSSAPAPLAQARSRRSSSDRRSRDFQMSPNTRRDSP
jgi:4-hydroxy-2-oxoheptanedioate aldolase